MVSVYIANASPVERAALRLLLKDLNLQVVGEGADWQAVLFEAPDINPDLLIIDYGLLESGAGDSLFKLRKACSPKVGIIMISNHALREQATLSSGADIFISKYDLPEDIANQIRVAAENIHVKRLHKKLKQKSIWSDAV